MFRLKSYVSNILILPCTVIKLKRARWYYQIFLDTPTLWCTRPPANSKSGVHFSREFGLQQRWTFHLSKWPLSNMSSRWISGTGGGAIDVCMCAHRNAFPRWVCVEAEVATNTQRPHRSLIVCQHNKSYVSSEIIYTRTALNKWITGLLNSRFFSVRVGRPQVASVRYLLALQLYCMTILVCLFFFLLPSVTDIHEDLWISWLPPSALCHWCIWARSECSGRERGGKENKWTQIRLRVLRSYNV